MLDPTREELIAYLHANYSQCGDDYEDGGEFDVEEAAYWLAAHHHGGQWSNLYAALCASPYTPGPCTADLPDYKERFTASALYDLGAEWLA